MAGILQCCRPATATNPADDPVAQMIVLDYYDGAASGFIQCKVCDAEYHFYMLDWDDSHAVRIFALAPVAASSMQRILDLVKASPDRRVWIPPILSRASEEAIADLYERGIQDIIDKAAVPATVIAWSVRGEKTLALRGVDAGAATHLSCWFDRAPEPADFDWFGYVQAAKLRQPA